MLQTVDTDDGGDVIDLDFNTSKTAAQIYQELRNLVRAQYSTPDNCSHLKELGEEAVVLCSGSQSSIGTSVGTYFVSQEPDLVQRFQQFCQSNKEILDPAPAPTQQQNAVSAVDSYQYDSNIPNNDIGTVEDISEELEDNTVDTIYDDDKDEDYVPETKIKRNSSRVSKVKNKGSTRKRKVSEEPTLSTKKSFTRTRNASKRTIQGTINKKVTRNEVVKNENKTKSDDIHLEAFVDSADSQEEKNEAGKPEGAGGEGDGKVSKLGNLVVVTPDVAGVSTTAGQLDVLKCFKCGKEYNGIGRLREHLTKVHKTKLGFLCSCERFFLTKDVFDRHTANGLHYDCEHCNKVFFREAQLKTHIREKHEHTATSEWKSENIDTYSCPTCGSKFELEHFLIMHRKKLPDCEKILSKEFEENKEIFNEEVTFKENGIDVKKAMSELVAEQTKLPYRCVICNISYHRKSNFTRHMVTHLSGGVNTCTICGMKFRGMDGMTRHKKEHMQKPYNCFNCRARFATEPELEVHVKQTCRGENMENLKCDMCSYAAPSRSALEKHSMKHTGVRPYTCTLCDKSMATSSSLERHVMAMHETKRAFQCDLCEKSFKTKDTYKKHLKTHREPQYHCEICGKGCIELGNLKKHMMTHTKEKPFVCEICGKAYGRKSLMENHRRLHTGEKPFNCNIEGCDKSFRSYSNLKQHIRSHSATHPFVCDICGKQFKQPGRLNHHRKDHLIDYRWPCAYCPNKYKSLFIYKNHLAKFHQDMKEEIEETTNIRLYQCSLCPKMYGDKEDLTRHIYIHNGQKPFKCQYCSKAFNDKSNLKQHEKIHTGDRKHVCSVCNKAFIHNKTLRLHMKTCHNKVAGGPHPGSRRESKVNEPAVVTERSLAVTMENNPMMQLTEVEVEQVEVHVLQNRPGMEGMEHVILKSGMRNDSTVSSVTLLQPMQPRNLAGEPIQGLLEPLMIIENF